MKPSAMRDVVCQVLLTPPDDYNWSDYPNVWDEVGRLIIDAPWYKVYDIAEALWAAIATANHWDAKPADGFQRRLNDLFAEKGIGWELQNGQIIHRGSDAFSRSTQEVPQRLDESGRHRAADEIREALADISRRPKPDITGAIQHAMAALEAIARDVTGQPNLTLGKLVPLLGLPRPLDEAVHKLWGYASDRGRHIREHQTVDHAEADLIVTVAASLCAFLASRS